MGSYDGLRASKGAFSEFLETYGKEESNNADARKGLSPMQHLHFLLGFKYCRKFEHILKALLRCLQSLHASAAKVLASFFYSWLFYFLVQVAFPHAVLVVNAQNCQLTTKTQPKHNIYITEENTHFGGVYGVVFLVVFLFMLIS